MRDGILMLAFGTYNPLTPVALISAVGYVGILECKDALASFACGAILRMTVFKNFDHNKSFPLNTTTAEGNVLSILCLHPLYQNILPTFFTVVNSATISNWAVIWRTIL